MKKISLLFILIVLGSYLHSQTFCLRFTEVNLTATTFTISLQMQGSTSFALGSSNLQFNYNTSGLSNPTFLSSPLGPTSYQVPTVSTPLPGEASLNIELGFAGFGTAINATPAWTEVGQIIFDVIDTGQNSGLSWSYNGGTTLTIVYKDDEATQLFTTNTDMSCLIGLDVPLDGSLPVELEIFSSQVVDNEVVNLLWKVQNEITFSGYELQRSTDGKNFLPIAWIPAQQQSAYTFDDKQVREGYDYYYRLKMIDMDGTYRYSPIQQADIDLPNDFVTAIDVFPNPTTESVMISYWSAEDSRSQLELLNEDGRILLQRSVMVRKGDNRYAINLSGYSAGIYFVRMKVGGEQLSARVVVIQR